MQYADAYHTCIPICALERHSSCVPVMSPEVVLLVFLLRFLNSPRGNRQPLAKRPVGKTQVDMMINKILTMIQTDSTSR